MDSSAWAEWAVVGACALLGVAAMSSSWWGAFRGRGAVVGVGVAGLAVAVGGGVWAWLAAWDGWAASILSGVLASGLIVLAADDLLDGHVDAYLLGALGAIGGGWRVIVDGGVSGGWSEAWQPLVPAVLGSAGTAGVVLVATWLSYAVRRRKVIGAGDVVMAAVAGVWVGPVAAMGVMVAATMVSAAWAWGVVLAARRAAAVVPGAVNISVEDGGGVVAPLGPGFAVAMVGALALRPVLGV